jgi:hypothetical protein
MKIAQIAPLVEVSLPDFMDGGTERIISYVTEELVALGHDVTLFASDSITGRLERGRPSASQSLSVAADGVGIGAI